MHGQGLKRSATAAGWCSASAGRATTRFTWDGNVLLHEWMACDSQEASIPIA